MTRLTPEAQAFRSLMEKERPEWPEELIRAATFVRMELDGMRLKSWDASGGPAKLKEYVDVFELLHDTWKAASLRDVQ